MPVRSPGKAETPSTSSARPRRSRIDRPGWCQFRLFGALVIAMEGGVPIIKDGEIIGASASPACRPTRMRKLRKPASRGSCNSPPDASWRLVIPQGPTLLSMRKKKTFGWPQPGEIGSLQRIETYREFWAFYLREHSHPACRNLHFLGTGLTLLALALGICQPVVSACGAGRRLWLRMVLALQVREDKPATFGFSVYPIWSLISDYRMFSAGCPDSCRQDLRDAGVDNPSSGTP